MGFCFSYISNLRPSMTCISRLCLILVGLLFTVVVGADVESQISEPCCICFAPLSEEGSLPLAIVKKPNKLSTFLRGLSSDTEPQFACCHADQFHKSCVEAWVDREHHNCPICRTEFKWSLSRYITFLESEENREALDYASYALVGMAGFLGSTVTLDQAGLKSEYITCVLIMLLIAWTAFSIMKVTRNSNSSIGWDALRDIR